MNEYKKPLGPLPLSAPVVTFLFGFCMGILGWVLGGLMDRAIRAAWR